MTRSRKARRVARREKRSSINWAAKFHEQYAVIENIGEVFYCQAIMEKGKAALKVFSGDFPLPTRLLFRPKQLGSMRIATDGDMVIARLRDELPKINAVVTALTPSCKALERKIKWRRERR